MILRALAAAIVKDFRLLARDRVGLLFMTIAPIVVITVAGFSLASLYGASPRGDTAYLLPIADEDGGEIGRALRERLGEEPAVELRFVRDRSEVLDLIARRQAGTALVIPPGTSSALRRGAPAELLLYTDPVKYLETANVRALVQELRHAIGREGIERARRRLERARAHAIADQRRLERRVERLRVAIERAGREGEDARRALAARLRDEIARLEKRRAAEIGAVVEARAGEVRAEIQRELAPLETFLAELGRYRSAFEAWLAAAREAAGSYADRLPAPPPPPELPAALVEISRDGSDAVAERIRRRIVDGVALEPLPTDRRPEIELAKLPHPPELPALHLRPPPELRLPEPLEIAEESVTGAPTRLNTFDQNVPGFSVTFLLLGMLLGVSLALIDERELGTLDRARASSAPLAPLIVGKLAVRFAVGVLQMVVLLAVGWLAFGVSLGPEPWGLLLPSAGIVFAGTAFGVLVAGLARSREAVLPLGSIAIVTMAAVGGCWWPIDLEPRWMRQVALGFPTTWAMAAFNDLMIRRQGAAAAIQPTLVLLGFGALFLALGLPLVSRRR